MPLYELVLVCKIGESHALASCLKAVSASILQEGGVVRGFNNLGDRVLTKNMRSEDGVDYSVGRFIQVSFNPTPLHLLVHV